MDAHGESIDASPDLRNAIEALRTAGRHPSRALADAVLRFGAAAVEPICALLRDPATWAPEELPDAMFPIHLIYLLGCLGDARATPTLVAAMQSQNLGDYLTEGMASVLGALSPEAVSALVPILLDHTADPFVRNAAGRGLYLLGCANIEARASAAAALARAMREADLENGDDFTTAEMLADDAVWTGDPDAIDAVRDAFARGLDQSGFTDESILERRGLIEPWRPRSHDEPPFAHFEQAARAPRKPSMGAGSMSVPVRAGPKVGRNDPCPCGSGKKYKKCCGR